MNSSHTITVVLPTFRRHQGLARVLSGLGLQEDPGVPWDLVVVDNEDAPGAQDVFQRVAAALSIPTRLVREPAKGACHARNRGLEEVTGSIVAFIDDDVVPDPAWLRTITEPIIAGRCEGTGGRVILDPSVAVPGWVHPHLLALLSAFDLGQEERLMDPVEDYILTANAAFLSAEVKKIGGFDPALGPREGTPMVNDDVDLFRRYVDAGMRMHYVPAAVVVHELPPERLTPRYFVRRAYAGGRSDWILDRGTLGPRRLRGVESATWRLLRDLPQLAAHGYWRRDFAMLASWLSRTAGFWREALADRRSTRSP